MSKPEIPLTEIDSLASPYTMAVRSVAASEES